jgi:nucleoside-diphosphate-sugar epimerase
MKVVVVGGAGYVGQVVVRELLAAGHEVKVIDLFTFALPGRLPQRLRWTVCDVRELRAWDLAGADAVLDLAAISNDPSGDLDPTLTRSINVEGRARTALLAKAVGVHRYLLFSSCSVYGVNDELVDERSALNPLTEYAVCNALAEERVLRLADAGFCATAFRLATVFGPSPAMRFDLVVNTMTRTAFDRGAVTVTGGGQQFRPLVHVGDVAAAACNVLAQPAATVSGEIFNVVHRNAQMCELADSVVRGIERPVAVEVDSSTIDRRNYRVDGGKAARVLGLEPARTVESAARSIMDGLIAGTLDTSSRSIRLNGYRRMTSAAVS